MKKRNPIAAAAAKLLVAVLSVGTLFPACAELETPTPEPNQRNLVINEFRYDDLPSEGGSVKPVISYSYEIMEEGRYVKKTNGAKLLFSFSNRLVVDFNDGTVTAPSNTSGETIMHQVKLTVKVNDLKAEKTVEIPQHTQEGVKSVDYTLVPLELGPHEIALAYYSEEPEIKMISESKDGLFVEDTPLEDVWNVGNHIIFPKGTIESVSCAGTQIPFTGGDLLKTVTYYDGRVETELEEHAVFSVEYSYPEPTDTLYYVPGHLGLNKTIPETLPVESIVGASVADGVWTINKIDSPFTGRGVHKLIATTSRGSQSITLDQNDNVVRKQYGVPEYYKFSGEHPDPNCDRLGWPDFEDYPLGSDPKWVRGGSSECLSWWASPYDTKGLHPDANRYIFFDGVQADRESWMTMILRSGDEFWKFNDSHVSDAFHNGIVITAEADIPTAEGIKHKELRYEWNEEEWSSLSWYLIYIPNYPEATDSFKWTVTFKYPKPETYVNGKAPDGRRCSNWPEVAHMFPDVVFTFDDFRSLREDWEASCAPWGPYNGSVKMRTDEEPTNIFEDGVEITWDKLTEGDCFRR